ncbi:MAG: hypothetical protein HY676_05470 [Chloroflexi bacterium]|nr:hypothetical protein [Chloroflexota bacterium]
MDFRKVCPGSIAIKSPTPEDIRCPNCGAEVEVWSHEIKADCPNCGTAVFRATRPSCIDWCKYAEQCFDPQTYARLKGAPTDVDCEH